MTLTIIDKDNVLLMRINIHVDKVCVIDDNERKILLISSYP